MHSYLTDTLHSLISELSPQEKEDSVIVVLIAEASGPGPGDRNMEGKTPSNNPPKRGIQTTARGRGGGRDTIRIAVINFIHKCIKTKS